MPEFSGHSDVRSLIRACWRWKWLFLAFVVIAPLAAYLIERGKPAEYQSTALVGVNSATVNTTGLSGGSFSTTNVTAIAQLVTTTPVATEAASLIHPHPDPGQIAGQVTATGSPITNFVTIAATDRSPVRAAQIANAFAHAISINRQQAAVAQISSAIGGVEAQLAHLKKSNLGQRPALEQELNQLQAAKTTQSSEAAILQSATPSSTPVTTSLRRTVELGLVIGILLGFGAVVLAQNADRRIRTPDDLEGITDLPLLAAISPTAFSGQLDTREEDEEAFNMLRTSLTYFNVERPLESIVVTSPGEKDGKTTIATRLAIAMTRAGLNVVLVDADLRRAQVSAKLGIQQAAGLGSVIAGEHSLSDALVSYPVSEAIGGHLTVLPAGAPPPNPSALISSEAMQHILRELESQSDIVIVDTPAALAVSDPLPLMQSVTGVVLVARMNNSTRETIKRLKKMIVAAHGELLGVVATGVASGPGYDGYAPKYYSHTNGHGPGVPGRLRRRFRQEGPGVGENSSVGDGSSVGATQSD